MSVVKNYIDQHGTIWLQPGEGRVEIPLRPSPFHVWNGSEWVESMEHLIAAKLAELRAAYEEAINSDIEYLGFTFQADANSRKALMESLAGGEAYAPDFWLDSSNVMRAMTFSELQGLAGAIIERNKAAFAELQKKKTLAKNVKTKDELNKITWDLKHLNKTDLI